MIAEKQQTGERQTAYIIVEDKEPAAVIVQRALRGRTCEILQDKDGYLQIFYNGKCVVDEKERKC